MVSRRLYEIIGLACGFVLVDYGFNFVAAGFPGARALTSQFLGGNLIMGGSAVVFISLYYLLKPAAPPASSPPSLPSAAPDVGVELIVEEETPPKASFYRTITYIGYFFTILGLFSVADLILQVFIRSIYNEARWWVEILLVIFGILSYTILVSLGRLGAQEEEKLTMPLTQPKLVAENVPAAETAAVPAAASYPESLEVHVKDFTRTPSGEYEKHLSGTVYDMFRTEQDMIIVWREDRKGIRSNYLAGPYELSRKLLEDQVKRAEELKIGALKLPIDSIHELLGLQSKAVETPASTKVT